MKDYYEKRPSSQPIIAQLCQLTHLTWDGDLISKTDRDNLVHSGYAQRFNGGWNLITENGINYLQSGGFINP